MRLAQVVLAAMIILLASFNCIASVHNSKVAPSDTARKLLSFQDVEPSKQKKHRESNENIPTEEERGVVAPVGGHAAGNNVVIPKKQDEDSRMVNVTKYSNNGVLQRFQRWLARTFWGHDKPSKAPRRLRLQI
ncbi:hypothetical protein JG687_00008470 [Phytophthora cactorum]|uniref:RxLR effector protein n=1 Tax=Phytophthora cactorum TaxID=29920 RepID=A0A329SIJ7_9STRA|nr:hypothetical protein Pcac1_g7519 [Phytophthora cactorum]KAG2814757.1 hypothetical protein PC112_g14183 [Phytophthora cactorum]KAG2816199.1 hypothetical protein PC111_g13237 [Phytophthora cactorum]KAG2854596.1 hypothetical protein PC113_g13157 [Phytophthora cactorum]KAG2888032.1 hypothetical protein PC114_g18565 [Phytophthora cactorum]